MRWREELPHVAGDEAIVRAMQTAGRAVVFSGTTVAIGLLALVALPLPFLRRVGYGGMLIPLISVLLVALTLLPMVLHSLGPRLDWPHRRTDEGVARVDALGGCRRAPPVARRRHAAFAVAALVLAATNLHPGVSNTAPRGLELGCSQGCRRACCGWNRRSRHPSARNLPPVSDLILQEHDLGLTWVHREAMARASHALVDDGRVWIIDPTDEDEPMDRVAALGEPAGVLQLLDRHSRDCAQVARRLQVPHISLPEMLPQAPFEPFWVVRRKGWNEVALDWPATGALIVAEAVGAGRLFAVGKDPVGVHPLLRLKPPRVIARPGIDHLLMGHGEGVHGRQAAVSLKAALDHARRDIPRLLVKAPFAMRG